MQWANSKLKTSHHFTNPSTAFSFFPTSTTLQWAKLWRKIIALMFFPPHFTGHHDVVSQIGSLNGWRVTPYATSLQSGRACEFSNDNDPSVLTPYLTMRVNLCPLFQNDNILTRTTILQWAPLSVFSDPQHKRLLSWMGWHVSLWATSCYAGKVTLSAVGRLLSWID